MLGKIRRFRKDTSGAVTVDWVVITAAIVGLAAGTIALVLDVTTKGSTGIGNFIDSHSEDLITTSEDS